jgi:alpha-tubulin suppressor-like RCC1 family protein
MIYSYIKPTANFYRQNNTTDPAITLIDSIDFYNFNSNCNEIGPYYQIDDDKYNVIYAFKHSDTGSYTIQFEDKYDNCNLEVLVVGGGGGGGLGTATMVGNGGSGGQVVYSNITIDSSKTYNIVVGDGGDGGDGGNSASAGENSSFDNIIANGGAGATTETIDVFYVNNSWIEIALDFKVEGVGYSNVEEKILNSLGYNFAIPISSIGAGSTTEDPSIGKYEETNSNFYTIYKNVNIGDYSDLEIYLGGGGKYGYYEQKVLSRSVYSCGVNDYGELGRTVDDNNTIPIIIDTYANLDSPIGRPNIVAISAGEMHSLFLDEYGYVYSCGFGGYGGTVGGLGHGNIDHKDYPTRIDILSNIVAISSGNATSLFLDENGYVYSCGYNFNGELGTGNTDNKPYPTMINNLLNIVVISIGTDHSLFLDNLGNVYSCGANSYGQLGRTGNNKIPMQITTNIGDSNIVAIRTGDDHSLFLDENGNVYSCGYNEFGQLGHGHTNNSSIPIRIDTLSNIVAISAGWAHSLFLDENGNVYSCGVNSDGQLGRTGNNKIPMQITTNIGDSNIVAISASKYNSLFLDENGNVYSCGNDSFDDGEGGALGRAVVDNNNTIPIRITDNIGDLNVVAISGGARYSFFITANVTTEPADQSASLGGGGNAIQDDSLPGKTLSGGGGSGGAIGNHPGGKGGSGIVLLKYSTGYNYYYPDEYYCNLPPLYQELTVRAENIFGHRDAILRFINQNKINTLAITDITVPTYKIDITGNITCNISSGFEIVYVDENIITNVTKNNEDLEITNGDRGLYYDVIINDSNYNYVYRIKESGDSAKPILVNNNNYFNLVSNSIIEYPNIFKNTYAYDTSEIIIYEITTYQDAFTIDKNKLIPVAGIESILFSESNVIEVDVSVSNLYQNNTETLRFFKIDTSTSNIIGLTNPTQIINFQPEDNSCNISIDEEFDIIFEYSDPNNNFVTKETDNILQIKNVGRLITYDVVIQLKSNNHSYIYRIIEPEVYRGPELIIPTTYFYSIDDKDLDPITHRIELEGSNIFKNAKDADDDLSITLSTTDTEFTIENDLIYSYIKPTYKQFNTTDPAITLSFNVDFSSFNSNCNEIGPYYQIDDNQYNVIYAFKHNTEGYNIKFEEKYNNCNLEVLVVGGGGGGGNGTATMPGNGGSGGEVVYSNITIDSSKTYNIVVGDGGDSASAGENSSFTDSSSIDITANGGAGATTETITPDIFYVNNVRTFTEFNFKVEGVGYSNVEEKLFTNLGCNFDSPAPAIGAGSTTEDPSIGKYEETIVISILSIIILL